MDGDSVFARRTTDVRPSPVTGWFGTEVRPVREGVYQRLDSTGVHYSYYVFDLPFCPGRWGMLCRSPESAYNWRLMASSYQHLPWRGLTAEALQELGL